MVLHLPNKIGLQRPVAEKLSLLEEMLSPTKPCTSTKPMNNRMKLAPWMIKESISDSKKTHEDSSLGVYLSGGSPAIPPFRGENTSIVLFVPHPLCCGRRLRRQSLPLHPLLQLKQRHGMGWQVI
mmetsp:Transcript_28369/g.60087  ORF Transcript_28369/g.60087 Transcript_28369/m.60087 type:complete len:125 (-) Transcript_28369:3156-3530(-)